MAKAPKYIYILALKDIIVFAGSNLRVVYDKFVQGIPVDMQKGIKSYAQYSRDILKCATITVSCPYYGTHTITKIELKAKLK